GHSSHTNFLIEFFEGGKGPLRPRPGFRVMVAPSAASKANDLSNQGQPTARSSRNLSDTKAIRLPPLEISDARSDISTYTSAADDSDLDQPSEIRIMHQYHDQGREVSARSASTQRCMDLDLGSEVSLMPPDSMHDVSRSVSNEQSSVMPRSRKPSRHYGEDDLVSNVESGVVTTSQLSPRRTSGDQYSFRSGTSKSSINNPKLIETVEEAIRRLILPELNTLKHEQTMQQNRQEFESNNRESPSASTSVGTGLFRRASKHAKRRRYVLSYSGKELVSLQMGGSVQSGRTKR
ncbi:hypothetical protein MMC31_007068, partial [Peltigera leucophlebia]|nr:hypothetical protein [Peltigera leucophlebia]